MRNMLQGLNNLDIQLTRSLKLSAPTGWLWRVAALIAHSGDSWVWAVGLILLWLFTSKQDGFWHGYAAILEISIVIQALLVFGIKALIRRERPQGEWGGIYRQYDPHSFPSGHATRAVLLAVMAVLLGPTWFGWLIAIWAPLVCLSRILTGLHYVSDILGGVLLGLLMGWVLSAVSPIWQQILPFLF